jgi:hypothetical protein
MQLPQGISHLAHALTVFNGHRASVELGAEPLEMGQGFVEVCNPPVDDAARRARANLVIRRHNLDPRALNVQRLELARQTQASRLPERARVPGTTRLRIGYMDQNCDNGCLIGNETKHLMWC